MYLSAPHESCQDESIFWGYQNTSIRPEIKYAFLYFFISLLKQKNKTKPKTLLPPFQESFLKANQKRTKNIYNEIANTEVITLGIVFVAWILSRSGGCIFSWQGVTLITSYSFGSFPALL